jgi:hypothetical protein
MIGNFLCPEKSGLFFAVGRRLLSGMRYFAKLEFSEIEGSQKPGKPAAEPARTFAWTKNRPADVERFLLSNYIFSKRPAAEFSRSFA